MLTLEDVARHWRLRPASIRQRIKSGELEAVWIAGRYRTSWADVWSCESGVKPTGADAESYKTALLTKRHLAAAMGVSTRTVERWMRTGLPTRSIGASTRFNRFEAEAWIRSRFGVDLREELGALATEAAR